MTLSGKSQCRSHTVYYVLVQAIAGLNIYDILEPCYHSKSTKQVIPQKSRVPQSFKDLGLTDKPLPVRTRMTGRAWPLRAPVREGHVPSWQELAVAAPSGVPCMVSTNAIPPPFQKTSHFVMTSILKRRSTFFSTSTFSLCMYVSILTSMCNIPL